MKIIEGKQYILCNLDRGWYANAIDLLPFKNQKVTVVKIDYADGDYKIRTITGKYFWCEAVNLKPVSINRRIE